MTKGEEVRCIADYDLFDNQIKNMILSNMRQTSQGVTGFFKEEDWYKCSLLKVRLLQGV